MSSEEEAFVPSEPGWYWYFVPFHNPHILHLQWLSSVGVGPLSEIQEDLVTGTGDDTFSATLWAASGTFHPTPITPPSERKRPRECRRTSLPNLPEED